MKTHEQLTDILNALLDGGFDLSAIGDGSVHIGCSQCEALAINGVACHEHNCPNTPHECRECGQTYASREDARRCCLSERD
jgi:hypothetical protein